MTKLMKSYLKLLRLYLIMNEEILNQLQKSSKITPSTEWDALYQERPVLIVSDVNNLQAALDKLEKVGGYGYIAIFRKDLFFFNTKLISKRCGLIDESGNLLKAARVPKN
jgi:hypothetical protein